MSNRCFSQQNFVKVDFSTVSTEEEKDLFVFNYSNLIATGKLKNHPSVAVIIFIDTSNVLLRGDSLKRELKMLESSIRKAELPENCMVAVVIGRHPRTGNNYFEFLSSDFVVSDYPIYILHNDEIPNLKFDNFSKFEYQNKEVDGMKLIRYRLEKGSCGKFNFLRPLHHEIFQIAKSIGSQNLSPKKNIETLEIKTSIDGLAKKIDGVDNEIKGLKDKLNEASAMNIRLEPSFRFANNFSEISYRLFYHDDDKSPHYFVFGISAGELQGNTRLDNYEYRNGFSTYSISGIQESSLTKFNGLSLGYKHIMEIDGPFELHTRFGMQLNRIVSSNYLWSSGEMDVRGKLDGIGDEIINVPELGFQENVSLVGVSGENEVRRFFGGVDLDLTFHYNLEKIDFFLGGGGIASTKVQPMESDALIFNGRQFNGLMSTVQPMSLINAYITLGASLIF